MSISLLSKWTKTLHYILKNGYYDKDRGFIECSNLNVLIDKPIDISIFAKKEYESIPVIPSENDCIVYREELIQGQGFEGVAYTYGQRLNSYFGFNQLENLMYKIKEGKDNSTSLYLSLWDRVKDVNSSNPPCFVSFWLRCRNNKIDMFATFRSHDIYRAWLLNAVGIDYLHSHICKCTNKEKGVLNINSLSAHIYEDCLNEATIVRDSFYFSLNRKQEYSDPIGNFIIERQDKKVVASLYRDKILVGVYSSTNPRKLIDDILLDLPFIEASHVAYIVQQISSI